MIKLMKSKQLAGIGLLLLMGFSSPAPAQQQGAPKKQALQASNLEGAWSTKDNSGNSVIMLVEDGFFTVARFNQQNKKFLGTTGGTYTAANGKFTIKYEFNTIDSTKVGATVTVDYKLDKNKWMLGDEMMADNWERIDESNSSSPLTGTWRITGREREGQMSTMRPGPRKTLKVLTGSRFQWIAFNSETGEFSGTGGGTYTAQHGKYTEHIEFFSRDPSRVGAKLDFHYEVKDGKWHHTGKSSTGNPVNEIWSRFSGQ